MMSPGGVRQWVNHAFSWVDARKRIIGPTILIVIASVVLLTQVGPQHLMIRESSINFETNLLPLLHGLVPVVEEQLETIRPGVSDSKQTDVMVTAWSHLGSLFVGLGPYIEKLENMKGTGNEKVVNILQTVEHARELIHAVHIDYWPCLALGDIMVVARFVDAEEQKMNDIKSTMFSKCIDEGKEEKSLTLQLTPMMTLCELRDIMKDEGIPDEADRYITHTLEKIMETQKKDGSFHDEDEVVLVGTMEVPPFYFTSHVYFVLDVCHVPRRETKTRARDYLVSHLEPNMGHGNVDMVVETLLFLKWSGAWQDISTRDQWLKAYAWAESLLIPGEGLCGFQEEGCQPHWHANVIWLALNAHEEGGHGNHFFARRR